MGIQILGTGSYVPEKILSNEDLERMMDTTDEWIRQRTGVVERRVAAPDQSCSDLALPACRGALEMAGLTADDLDMVILCTITPDTHCPSGANWLQAKLGAQKAVTFDVTAACSGFVFGLNVAEQYLKNGAADKVMVVASEVMTRTVDYTDRTSAILWGDGAGAALLTAGEGGHQLRSTHIHSDGANGQNLLMPGGGSNTTPISYGSVDAKAHNLKMIDAANSFKVAVRRFVESAQEACIANGVDVKDVNWIIPHQANLRMIQAMAKRLDKLMERVYLTVHKFGNISSASAAIALDEAVRTGSIKPEDLVVLTVFGGGLTWGSALIEW